MRVVGAVTSFETRTLEIDFSDRSTDSAVVVAAEMEFSENITTGRTP